MSRTIRKTIKAKGEEWVEVFVYHNKRQYCLQVLPDGICLIRFWDKEALNQKILYRSVTDEKATPVSKKT